MSVPTAKPLELPPRMQEPPRTLVPGQAPAPNYLQYAAPVVPTPRPQVHPTDVTEMLPPPRPVSAPGLRPGSQPAVFYPQPVQPVAQPEYLLAQPAPGMAQHTLASTQPAPQAVVPQTATQPINQDPVQPTQQQQQFQHPPPAVRSPSFTPPPPSPLPQAQPGTVGSDGSARPPLPHRIDVVCNKVRGVFIVDRCAVACQCEQCAEQAALAGRTEIVMSATEFERHAGAPDSCYLSCCTFRGRCNR